MENNFIASSIATDLSQLILSAKPLEVLSVERNQEDNQKVLAFVNGFLDVVDAELAIPKSYKEYVLGKKDTFIRSEMVSRLELVASRIIEKKTLGCSTVNLEELNFFQEELNFMIDLYHLLVTSLIDLSAIRKTDLVDRGLHDQLYDIIIAHMEFIGAYPELQSLIDELHNRKDDYPDHPKLQAKIKELMQYSPIQDGDFLFTPARSVSDYSLGDVLIAPHPDSGIVSLEVGDLPPGVAMDDESGRLYVQEKDDLVAGFYNVLVSTSDEIGGFTQHQLELPIGSTEIAYYEVAPYRVIEDYMYGEVLARPISVDGSMPIFQAKWGSEIPDIPNGVLLDEKLGTISVQDENVLEIGIYPVEVILTYQGGSESRHEFVLSFKQDRKAIYTFQSAKLLKDYKSGDTLASVSDDDGKIIQAQKNKLPAGMRISDFGSIVVSEPKELRPGTHRFNVLTLNEAKFQAVKTLFITLDADPNPFYYEIQDVGPIDTLKKGSQLAKLVSASGKEASKVVLAKGMMPPGTQLESNGDVSVANGSKLETGNYDLSMRVFMDLDEGALENLLSQKAGIENSLATENNQLIELQSNLEQTNNEYTQYQVQQAHAIQVLNREIAEIEKKIETAEGEELEQLQQQLAQKQTEQQELFEETEAGYSERLEAIDALTAQIQNAQNNIDALEESLNSVEQQIVNLRANRWVEYQVQLLLTLEEDNESAWHLEIPKFWDEYSDNELIAQIVDCDGHQITEIIEGEEPAGIKLDGKKGQFSVFSRSLLSPGEYVIKTRSTDLKSGETEHRLAIVIGGEDIQQTLPYNMLPPKPANNYVQNEIIGYPYLPSQQIVSTRVTNGILPSGIVMNPVTGELIIADPEALRAGEYTDITAKSITDNGATQYFEIDILIASEVTFDVLIAPPKNLEAYRPNDTLIAVRTIGSASATPTKDTSGASASRASRGLQGIQVVGGDLVSGAAVSSATGKIYVKTPELLQAGEYSLDLLMLETNGATDQQTIAYVIGLEDTNEDDGPVNDGLVTVALAELEDFHTLFNNDIIAKLKSKQRISAAIPQNSSPGLAVNRQTGDVFIEDRTALLREAITLTLNVSFEDTTVPAEEVYVSVDFRPIPNYEVDEQTLQFSSEVRERIGEFEEYISGNPKDSSQMSNQQTSASASQMDSQNAMQSGTAASGGNPLQFAIDWADNHVFHLSNQDLRMNYYLAKDDADNLRQYMKVVQPILQVMEQRPQEPNRSLIMRLYNEIFVSAVSISLYRGNDVSIRKDNPVGRMYAAMDAHLNYFSKQADIEYIRENANFIADKMNPNFPNLIAHFAKLKA